MKVSGVLISVTERQQRGQLLELLDNPFRQRLREVSRPRKVVDQFGNLVVIKALSMPCLTYSLKDGVSLFI